jgi:hypothetical protein
MQRNDSENMLKEAWRNFHRNYGFNILPVGHKEVVRLAIEAHLDLKLQVELSDYLQVAPAQVLDRLRSYLKMPTFSSEVRKLIGKFFGDYSERGIKAIPSLYEVTGIRKADDKNSYEHFYVERISDEIAEKMITTYGDMASGIALLLREENQVIVFDFDNRQALIELLNQVGFPCNEETLVDTLLRVFPYNPIVKTYRGFHVYCYDPDLAEIVKTYRDLGGIEIRASHCYVLLPPSTAGFRVDGNTIMIVKYDTLRDLTPENIRAPLPTVIRDYFVKQLRPQTQAPMLSLAFVEQSALTSDLKSFVIDTLVAYWKKGVRDKLTYSLAGVLRRGGVLLNDALDIIATICDRAGDEEKSNRLYQVRRQYMLSFNPDREGAPFCAGAPSFVKHCIEAGIPPQIYKTIVNRLYGFSLTANIEKKLQDKDYLGGRILNIIRNDIVYNEHYGAWFVFRDRKRCWVKVKREEALHFVMKAAAEVHKDLKETLSISFGDNIPQKCLKSLDKLLERSFVNDTIMTYIETNLCVDFEFPHIPDEIKASLPAEVTRITSHRNGVLLWLKNGDTVFLPCDRDNPEGDLHRHFFITYTIDSEVSETADMQPFLDKVAEWVAGRENAEFILKHLATVLGLGQNINNKFLLFIGDGRNGKNSFIQVLEAAFENLVRYTTSEILTARRFDNNLNSTLSELSGCAFAVIDEAPDPSKWNVENVKRLTGSDKTQARRLYHDVEIVDITWLFIILTNEFPTQFKRQSQGLAHRIIAVNFPVTYSDNVINEGRFIKRRNSEEVEYFKRNPQVVIQAMRWAFKEAAKTNFVLTEPEQISQFTRPIKLKADSVSYFLSKYTIDDAHAEIPLQELYQAYCQFVKEEGIGSPLPDNIFAMRLYTKNIQHERRNGRTYIIGLRLKESALFEPANSLVSNDSGGDGNGNGNGQATEPADRSYLDEFPF